MTNSTSLVSVQNGVPCASSLSIAERFDRQHRTVLAAIRKASIDLPQDFSEQNFMLAEYLDRQGKSRPMYLLTRDGFSFVCMGFTGKKAARWKVAYINAFNAMARRLGLDGGPTPDEAERLRLEREQQIKAAMVQAFFENGYHFGKTGQQKIALPDGTTGTAKLVHDNSRTFELKAGRDWMLCHVPQGEEGEKVLAQARAFVAEHRSRRHKITVKRIKDLEALALE